MYGSQTGTLSLLQKEETCTQRKQGLKKYLGIAGHLMQLMLYS